ALFSLVAVAILEEMLHRGWLLAICRTLPGMGWRITATAGMILAFALIHLPSGWPHVMGKAPLSFLTTVAVVGTGTVMAAIVAHVWFNVRIWSDQRARIACAEEMSSGGLSEGDAC